MIYTFDSTQAGAPVLSGTAGALRGLLKACLVDGFAASGVTSITVAGEVATVTYSAPHAFKPGRVALYAGATPAGLNGEKRVLSTTANTLTFAAPGVADGPATGTITSKAAPAGWSELFAGTLTNVLALKPTAVEATGCVLRVDDTGTTNARVRAYESMSDISTGQGVIPLESQVAGGLWWPKSFQANATARAWTIVADARGFYLCVSSGEADRYVVLFAGDIASLKSGDAYGFLLTGNMADQTAAVATPDGCCGFSHRGARDGAYLARAHTAIGQAIPVRRIGAHHNGPTADCYSGMVGYSWGNYPNAPNNGLLVAPLEVVAQGVRGTLPGLLHVVQAAEGSFSTGGLVEGTDDMAGKALMAVRVWPPGNNSSTGTVFLDVTGPWVR